MRTARRQHRRRGQQTDWWLSLGARGIESSRRQLATGRTRLSSKYLTVSFDTSLYGDTMKHSLEPRMDRLLTYQITVQGRHDRAWSDWFCGMAITYVVRSVQLLLTTLLPSLELDC